MKKAEQYIRELPSCLGSYKDAVPQSEVCIQKAIKFADLIDKKYGGFLVNNTVDGSVLFEIKTNVGYEIWDFYPDGEVGLMVIVGGIKLSFDATEQIDIILNNDNDQKQKD